MTEEVQETMYIRDRERMSPAGAVWYCVKAVLMGFGIGWLVAQVLMLAGWHR